MNSSADRTPSESETPLLALRTAVVRLKSYGKGEDTHVCKTKRHHLLVLTPDALQLFTTTDAGSQEDLLQTARHAGGKAIVAARTYGAMFRLGGGNTQRADAAQQGKSHSSGDSKEYRPSGDMPPTPDSDSDDLEEGQVFRLGVALGQILSMQVIRENRLFVTYQPNRPSKRNVVEEQTLHLLRGLKEAVGDALQWRDAAGDQRRRDPNAHHFTIVAADGEEAAALKESVLRAQRQLAEAVQWLAQRLPLRPEVKVVMVTVTGGSGSDRESRARHGQLPGQLKQMGESGPAYTLPFPQWGAQVELPASVGAALAAPISRQELETSVAVYFSSALGPAVAEISMAQLQRSAAEGSSPLTTVAVLRWPPGDEPGRPGKRWEVALQWYAVKGGPVLPPAAARLGHRGGSSGGGSSGDVEYAHSRPSSPERWRSRGQQQQLQASSALTRPPAGEVLAAAAAVSILLALLLRSGGGAAALLHLSLAPLSAVQGGGAGLLLTVAAVSGMASMLRMLRQQLARLRAPQQAPVPQPQRHRWYLVLVDADLEESTDREEPAAPPIKRTITIGAARAPEAEAELPTSPGGPLPLHINLLVEQHPTILTRDIARRFVVGLGSESKAFTALTSMLTWTVDNKLEGILSQPQPAFAVMKRHYPHGFLGWSKKSDSLVDLECMGRWPAAYTAVAADGVSEQQMLEHLLFTYQYAFSRLDARPLPHGKTVKIIDLDGLGMSDLKTPGFRLITRVGAMLALNYPQRLHRCFLVNAPGWWAVAWRIITPLIPARVRGQMSLFGKNDKQAGSAAILEWVDAEVVPVRYGGTNPLPLEECDFEVALAGYVAELGGGKAVTT